MHGGATAVLLITACQNKAQQTIPVPLRYLYREEQSGADLG